MALWMCTQHVKVRLLNNNREILDVLKNCPSNYFLAHSIVLKKLLWDQFAQRDSTPARGAHLRDGCRWRLEVRVTGGWLRRRWGPHGAGVNSHGSEVLAPCQCSLLLGAPCAALSYQCCLLLGGAPVLASMKGQRRLRRRGPGTRAAATIGSRRLQHAL
jgi:hypothetical protein